MALRRRRRSESGPDAAARAEATGGLVPEPQRVVVVTDSTASLPAGAAERCGIEVVPLEVALGDVRHREGVDLPAAELLAALAGGTRVTTSQPSPLAFAQAYARAAERGAREVVSVHLSGELSGTVRAAELAALGAPVPVHVVDSRTVVMGLGFAAMAAAEAAAGSTVTRGTASGAGGAGGAGAARGAGGTGPGEGAAGPVAVADGAQVAERARSVAAGTVVLFVVDSLDHLRRGGRIGATAAAVGSLLGMRPLLTVRDGRVEVAGSVRTRRAARERLLDTAVREAASRPGSRVAVHHLGRPDVAEELAVELRKRLQDALQDGLGGGLQDRLRDGLAGGLPSGVAGPALGAAAARRGAGPAVQGTAEPGAGASAGSGRGGARHPVAVEPPEVVVADVSAVIGAHAGPGLLGVVVAGP